MSQRFFRDTRQTASTGATAGEGAVSIPTPNSGVEVGRTPLPITSNSRLLPALPTAFIMMKSETSLSHLHGEIAMKIRRRTMLARAQ